MHLNQGYLYAFLAFSAVLAASYYAINCPNHCNCNCDANECLVDCSGIPGDEINFTQLEDLPPIPMKLSLKNCQLERVPEDIKLLNIKSLDLSHNNIKSIEESDISNFSALEHLDVSYNYLENVISFKSNSLKALKMSHNDIKSISKNTFECPQLTLLDLNHNRIKDLHDDILPDKLETLLFANNSIEHLNLEFSNLKQLDISNNGMRNLKITSSSKLERIWMKGNFLDDCDDKDFKKLHKFLQGKVNILVDRKGFNKIILFYILDSRLEL
ncbi:IGFALS.2 family protein [Megaselia abdita]